MTPAQLILTFRCLIADTFRQAMASGMMWFVLFCTALCVFVCLGISSENDQPEKEPRPFEQVEYLPKNDVQEVMSPGSSRVGGVDLLQGRGSIWGLVSFDLGRHRQQFIRHLQIIFAGIVADAGGIMLALVWTAGFIPTFLEPGAAAVLLAKPAPRWCLILGKYVGVLVFVLFQATIFVGGTYVALAVRSGLWGETAYLLCIPMLLIHFAIFFSFSTLIAVTTRSTIACVFATLVFWLLCWGMNFGRHQLIGLEATESESQAKHMLVLAPTPTEGLGFGQVPWAGIYRNTAATAAATESVGSFARGTTEVFYWITPKPLDMLIVLNKAMEAEKYLPVVNIDRVEARHEFRPWQSILSSLLFTLVTLGLAVWYFSHTDY